MKRLEALAADSGTLQVYLREIARFPRLTPAQEQDLARRIQQAGDEDALRQLVESNLRFVVHYAKRYRHLGVPFLDLIHEGNLGLIEAARRFDPGRNVRFITYGVWWIRQSVLHLLAEFSRAYALPPKVSGAAARFGRQVAALQAQLEHAPTVHEIADELEMSEEDAQVFLQLQADDVSLSDRVWRHGPADGDGVELADILPNPAARRVDDELTREAASRALAGAIESLEPRERQVMRLRYGLDTEECWTLERIGRRLQLSRERVRQIEHRALQKLRRRKNLRSYLN